jgi:hypothetical protein
MDRQTLRDWVHRYNAASVEGLKNARSFLIDDPDRIRSIGSRDWARVNV